MPRKKLKSYLEFGDPEFDPENPEMVEGWVNNILEQHKDKNFVDRIINPEIYPRGLVLKPGTESGHKMMTFEVEGKHVVAPRIIHDEETDTLIDLKDPKKAILHALESGEYIPFDTPESALFFSLNYKKMNENTLDLWRK